LNKNKDLSWFNPAYITDLVYTHTMQGKDLNEVGFTNILIAIASVVIIIAGLYAAEPVLVPVLLAVFIALLSLPLQIWLQRKGLPMLPALILVVTLILGLLTGVILLIGSSLNELIQNIPYYQTRMTRELSRFISWLNEHGLDLSQQQIVRYFDPGVIFSLLGNLLSGLGNVMTKGVLILLTVIFILAEAASFPGKIKKALGNRYNERFFNTFTVNIQRYMRLKTAISLVTGICVGTWVAIIGVDYPVLWGFIGFLFNFVPNIGSIMAAVPVVLLAFVDLGWGPAVLIALGYLAINIIIGDLIEPRLMGRGLGLSTLVVFLSLVLWAWVLGPVGMFLSVPLTMTLKIAFDSHEKTRWLAILLGPSLELDAAKEGQTKTA